MELLIIFGSTTLLQQAKSEAAAAFGNDGVYLEKYVQNPRHIEFQVIIQWHYILVEKKAIYIHISQK